jgi:hypothetical protein
MQRFMQPREAPRWSEDAHIDPKIIVHQPQASLKLQAPGIPIAQNEYPNLQMLPIGAAGAKLKAIPVQWPNLKVEAIPSKWPSLKMDPVQSGTESRTGQSPTR